MQTNVKQTSPVITEYNDTEGFWAIGASIDILDTFDIYTEYLTFGSTTEKTAIGTGIRLDF